MRNMISSPTWDRAVRYALAVGAVGLALVCRMALSPFLGSGSAFITFFPAVMLAAVLGGLGPGLLATALSTVAVGYWVFPSKGQFALANTTEAFGLAVFAGMGVFMSLVAKLYHQALQRATHYAKELALREGEARLRLLADAMPLLIWQCNAEGQCDNFNQGWLQFTGRTMEQELGDGWIQDVHPEDWPRVQEVFGDALRRRAAFQMEYRLRHHSGAYRWILDPGVPRFSADGQFLGYVGTCTDIDERKQAEEALRESEMRFRKLTECIPHTVWETDAHGQNLYQSPAWYAYIGQGEGSSFGKDWLRFYHPEDRDLLIANWSKSLATEGAHPYDIEVRIRRHDGAWRWFRVQGAPVRDADGRVVKWAGTCSDINARKQAEEALRRSQELLQRVLEALPVGVWMMDETGRIVSHNPAALSIWAGARHVPIEQFGEYKGWWHETGEPIAAEEWAAARAIRKGETSIDEVIDIQCFDGTRKTILNSALPIQNDQGESLGAIIVNQDITELKRIEQLLRVQADRLAAADRQKDQFLAMVAHDLRSPIGVILAHSEFLEDEAGRVLDEQHRQFITTIKATSHFLLGLIDNLLDVAQLEAGKLSLDLQPVDLAELVRHNVALNRLLADRKQIELRMTVDGPPAIMMLDPAKIEQILNNLIGNAVKFSYPRTRIEIIMNQRPEGVGISVRDQGQGIPEDDLEKLFKPFGKTRVRGTGGERSMGLGLAIVQNIVKAHGGRIRVVSEVGCGTTVDVELPYESQMHRDDSTTSSDQRQDSGSR